MDVAEIIKRVETPPINKMVELTGGEPLIQNREDLEALIYKLYKGGHRILVETNGSIPLTVNRRLPVSFIMDIKCPCSGEENSFNKKNLEMLGDVDEVKFVVENETDLGFSRQFLRSLNKLRIPVAYSPVFSNDLGVQKQRWQMIAEFVKELNMSNVRMQIPLHTMIWGRKRGV
jgi:7-carboxy-7-deazaguanine synthase